MTSENGRTEQGETLIEVLIAVAIIGIAFVGLIGGMTTGIVASASHRSQADARAVLVAAVEKVKSSDTLYVNCATPATYLPAAQSVKLPGGTPAWTPAAINITSVQYWNGSAFVASPCQDVTIPLYRLQLIDISVTSPDTSTTERTSFVKRG